MADYVWIVEMWDTSRSKWVPTVGVGLSRVDAQVEMQEWANKNQDDRFRCVRYFAKEAERKHVARSKRRVS